MSRDTTRRLVLLRHGRTAWNLAGRAQGHTDVPLDEEGLSQARTAAVQVARFAPTRLWSSDLARARQTAEEVGAACDLSFQTDVRLREYDVGVRSGLTLAEFAVRYPEEHARYLAGEPTPGGESDSDVTARMLPALAEAAESLGAGECGVVVSHGAALRVGVAAFLGWPIELRASLGALGNCHWVVLEHRLAAFDGAERWRLHGWNISAPSEALTPDFATDEPAR